MSHTAAQLPLTVEDLYRLPDDNQHYELAHGWLVSEPPPGVEHGRIASRVTSLLDAHVREHKAGVVVTCDTGFILHRSPDTVRAPDVAFIRMEKYRALADNQRAMPGAPDIAVEILSPGNRATDVHAKVADYLAAGTLLVWLVDPVAEQVHSYRKLLEPTVLSAADLLTAEELLPGFRVPVKALFEI